MYRIMINTEVVTQHGLFFVFKNKTFCQVQNTYLKSKGFPDFLLFSSRFWYFIDHNELNHDPQKIVPCPNNQNV